MSRRNVTTFRGGNSAVNDPDQKTHTYEVHPRKDHHGVNLISDVLPFGRLWYDEPNAINNAVNCAGGERFEKASKSLDKRKD